jgi:hypothetical protein
MPLTLFMLLLQVAQAMPARHVAGVVVDPQGLPVAGVVVTLTCDDAEQRETSGADGAFAFSVGTIASSCTITAARAGFATRSQSIDTASADRLVLRLAVQTFEDTVRVDAPAAPIGSIVLDGGDVLEISTSLNDVIRYAALASGHVARDTVVYLDGLPAMALPPAEMVGQLRVNTSPFSAEYGDGDVTRIELIPRGVGRRLRITPGGSFLGFGDNDGLRPELRTTASSGNVSFAGPVPRTPMTFSGDVRLSRSARQVPLLAVLPETALAAGIASPGTDAATSNDIRTTSLSTTYAPSRGARLYAGYTGTATQGDNVGVGGLVLPSAGLQSGSAAHTVHVSVTTQGRRWLSESGFVGRAGESSTLANSDTPGVLVQGAFVAGGAPMRAQNTRRLNYTARQVVRSASPRAWSAGVIVSGSSESHRDTPNAFGSIAFDTLTAFDAAVDGAATGVRTITGGTGAYNYDGLTVSPFVQTTVAHSARLQVDAGVRGDYQRGVGATLSPRLSMATSAGGFRIEAGAGTFTTFVPDGAFVAAAANDGRRLQPLLAADAPLTGSSTGWLAGTPIVTTLSPSLSAARQLMTRAAIERRVGAFTPSLEYAWIREIDRAGSDRQSSDGTWIDVIDSNRRASRQRTTARLRYGWRRNSLTASYEWLRARDNGDGVFSYPQRSGDLTDEWAPAAGLAPQAVVVTAALALPWRIDGFLTGTWQSATPYNVTAGRDLDGNGLFTERGGLPRNSGRAPAQEVLALHASRRVMLTAVPWFSGRLHADVGVHVDNLLDRRNSTSLGSVVGSQTFGQPLSAMPGRSIRFTMTIG